MTKEELQASPISNIADKDCSLFLWVTYPTIIEAFELITAWGFIYKTVAFTLVKKNKVSDSFFTGLGYWTRANAELCLLATKGKPKRVSKSIKQLIVSPIEKHSKKPDEARERIVELLGDLPRVELFARQQYTGWDSIGNEIDGRDIRDVIL